MQNRIILTSNKSYGDWGTIFGDPIIATAILDRLRHQLFPAVAAFEDVDWAIAQANATRYGLSAYVWTSDLKTALRTAERLEFGIIGVNEWSPQGTEVPFTGWKESGLGREAGPEGLEEYLETKSIAFGGLA